MSLVDRVKGLTGPDREVDLAIAQALVPDVIVLRHNRETGQNEPYTHWEYTKSIDAAVALVERVLPGWVWDVSSTGSAWMMRDDDANNTHVTASGAPNPAIALILALLQTELNKEDR